MENYALTLFDQLTIVVVVLAQLCSLANKYMPSEIRPRTKGKQEIRNWKRQNVLNHMLFVMSKREVSRKDDLDIK